MKSEKTFIVILSMVAALLLASLACNLPSNSLQTQTPEETTPVPPKTELLSTQPPGSSTVTLTEGQLKGFIQQALQYDTSQSVRDMQVHFKDGQVDISGTVTQQGLELPLTMTVLVSTNGEGGLQFKINSAKVGPFALPQSIQNQVETLLNQNLQNEIQNLTDKIYIDNVNVGNGVITVTGHTQ